MQEWSYNYSGTCITPKDRYLAHYGVPGMKWGVRHDRKSTTSKNGKSSTSKNINSSSSKTKNKTSKQAIRLAVKNTTNSERSNYIKKWYDYINAEDKYYDGYINKNQYHDVYNKYLETESSLANKYLGINKQKIKNNNLTTSEWNAITNYRNDLETVEAYFNNKNDEFLKDFYNKIMK